MPNESSWTQPATELAASIRRKELSPVELTEALLARIEQLNPTVNAFVMVTAELALAQARAAEEAVMRGDELGLLHGVPYALKDFTPTKGLRTTMGSKLFEHHVPDEDALLVERMRDAGSVLLGKTNLPELGAKGTTDNRIFGETRNPWDLERTTAGSSGGAAAAVAMGMAPLAEGSDHAGSIRCPASFCGLVGLKPSDGRVPFQPNNMLFQAVTFCNGPITRTVADAALMLDVIAGPDDRDPRSLVDGPHDFSAAVAGEPSIAGLRVGWLPDLGFIPVDPLVADTCAAAVGALADLGCSVEEDHTDFSDVVAPYALINATRRAALVDPYLPERADEFDPEVLWRCELAQSRTAVDFGKALVVQSSAYERVRTLLQRYDVLVTPTVALPPFPLPSSGWRLPEEIGGRKITNVLDLAALTFLFNLTGHPAISVPAGWTDGGLPIGLQIVGPWRDDAAVLRVAAAYERARPWRDRWPAAALQPA